MTPEVTIFDDRPCLLGEGPLWHPERQQLFWFDILGQKLLTRAGSDQHEWSFDRAVSAAGWVDHDTLLIASETDLFAFDLTRGTGAPVATLEADNGVTRSNDGRADPYGGFWIGTMGHQAEAGVGALYRYYRGEIRKLRGAVTIPNATCFSPDGRYAYFADTAERLVWAYRLDDDGWPVGAPEVFLDHRAAGVNPDGAVVDSAGTFWCAEWGGSRLARYGPDGALIDTVALPAPQPTCPAFGGDAIYVTTARQGLPDAALDAAPASGKVLRITGLQARGQDEHRVIL